MRECNSLLLLMTSYHKLSGLNHIHLVLSRSFCRSKFWAWCNWVLCSGLYKADVKIQLWLSSHLEFRTLIHIPVMVGRIKFLAPLGLRTLCCLTDFQPGAIQIPKGRPQILVMWSLHSQFTTYLIVILWIRRVYCFFWSFIWLPD